MRCRCAHCNHEPPQRAADSPSLWLPQVSGLLLTIVGFALSVSWVPDGYHFSHPHNIIGLVVVVLAMLQPLNSLARGKPAAATGGKRTTRRAVWELMHKGGGYAIIIMGVYQARCRRARSPARTVHALNSARFPAIARARLSRAAIS